MAEDLAGVLAEHQGTYVAEDPDGHQWCIRCGGCEKALKGGYGNTAWDEREALLAAHQAEQLAENGYGKFEDAWDEGFDRGFYDPLAGSDKDASESGAKNPYRRPE